MKRTSVALAFAGLLLASASASATSFTSQSSFDAAASAVGALATETFDSYGTGAAISSLPSLGIKFDTMGSSGLYPVAWPVLNCGGGIASSPNALLNSSQCSIPPGGQGDIVFRAINPALGVIGVGFYNASTDDSLVLSFLDATNQVIESLTVGGGAPAFIGIVATSAAASFSIHPFGGNNLFAVDNLEVAIARRTDVADTPEPNPLALLVVGLASLVLLGRRGAPRPRG